MVCSLASIHFDSPQVGMLKKETLKLYTIDPEICSKILDFSEKGLGILSQNPLPADHLRINKINDNPKRFILLYPTFRWINKIKLEYFVVKFSILLQCMIFQEDWSSCYILLTDPFCVITLTSWDTVHCNCLFPRLRCRKLWNKPYLSRQTVLIKEEKIKTKI